MTTTTGHCPQNPELEEYHTHRESGEHAEWCIAGARPSDGDGSSTIKQPIHKVTRTIQLQLTFQFSDVELATAKLAARERGCSQHKVLAERLRANAARLLRNNGFTVANA